jgi:hypothetical protein
MKQHELLRHHLRTLIDHFITNEPEKISKCGVIHTGIRVTTVSFMPLGRY